MQVVISADTAGEASETASLRAWLDSAGEGMPWDLAPMSRGEGTLGIGVDEICAVLSAVEGLPVLVQWIKNWRTTRQDPVSVKLTITIGSKEDDVTAQLPDASETEHVSQPHS